VDERIHVQIPAYRDPELVATVRDLLSQARRPERLSVWIAWQFGPHDQHVGRSLHALPGVHVVAVPAAESQGCNWARRILQHQWDGEEYTLFLDSHHRFAEGWDEILVSMHRGLLERGVERPLLTGYLPPYDPVTDPAGRVHAVYRIAVAERIDGMPFRLVGHPERGDRLQAGPMPAEFVSLHCLFAEGRLNERLPFDPSIYFFADEVAIAVRAYTHGYDLFSPNLVLGWHLYDRRTRTTHWADHPEWRSRHRACVEQLRRLLTGSASGEYALGNVRTMADYEAHTGVSLLLDAPARVEGGAP